MHTDVFDRVLPIILVIGATFKEPLKGVDIMKKRARHAHVSRESNRRQSDLMSTVQQVIEIGIIGRRQIVMRDVPMHRQMSTVSVVMFLLRTSRDWI